MVNKYKLITDLVVKELTHLEYLLPSDYEVLFTKIANEQGVNISSLVLNKFVAKRTMEQSALLEKNIELSITAIETQDKQKLKTILEEIKKLNFDIKSLKELVYKDPLTKAKNRQWLNDAYLNEDDTLMKANGFVSLIDINDFKIINDTFGHSMGDKILVYITNELTFSQGDIIRLGGDEFLVFFSENTSFKKVDQIMGGIRDKVASKNFRVANKHLFKTSFAFGTTAFKVGDMFEQILLKCDELMYKDKVIFKKNINKIENK